MGMKTSNINQHQITCSRQFYETYRNQIYKLRTEEGSNFLYDSCPITLKKNITCHPPFEDLTNRNTDIFYVNSNIKNDNQIESNLFSKKYISSTISIKNIKSLHQ